MTARQIWEFALIENNKLQAPSLLLEEYNYFINKAIYNYINLKYNIYDLNQQTTDDIRVLKGTATLTPTIVPGSVPLQGASYQATLPRDYLHLLNCIVEYEVQSDFKCYETEELVYFGAKRLTADMFGQIINNAYMRPMYKRPYYYIHNNAEPVVDTNPTPPNVPEIVTDVRYGNSSDVRIEIRYGRDNTLFELTRIFIDYIKVPKHVRLTQTQIDTDADTSQVMEFPDYVCQEIIKELVKLLMENASDPRLQTNIPVNQTIAPPAQAQAPAQSR